MARVKLSAILEGMEMQSDETHALLDRRTGDVLFVSDEEFRAAEEDADPSDYPEWQRENIERAKTVEADTTGRFVALPDPFEIDEWHMMQDFAFTVDDDALAESILRAIQGRGAFRHFKDLAGEAGLADRWCTYRDEQYREVALEWCEFQRIDVDPNT